MSHVKEAARSADAQGGASFLPRHQLLVSTHWVPGSDPVPAVCPGASYLPSLCLGFFTSKMG